MSSTVAVGTDGRRGVKVATEVARRFDAELVLVSAFQESAREPLDRASASEEVQWAFSPSARVRDTLTRTEQSVRRDGIACRALVDEGDPADVLIRLAAECGADVLVIGNKGMDGSTGARQRAEQRHAQSPMLSPRSQDDLGRGR